MNSNYKFFKSTYEDTRSEKEESNQTLWSPFEEEINIILEYWYTKYKDGRDELLNIWDLSINFEDMYIFNKSDNTRKKILRDDPKNIKLILREENKFASKQNKIDLLQSENEIKKIGKTLELNMNLTKISSQIEEKYTEMQLNLLPGKEIKFLLVNTFKNEMTINYEEMNMESLKLKLIREFDFLAEKNNAYNIYKYKYLDSLNEDNFCVSILRMYSEEGFLYRQVNRILREKSLKQFKNIECYYICLLAAFQHCSTSANSKLLSDPEIDDGVKKELIRDKKLYLYRGSTILDDEIQILKQNKNPLRICNEFLSCTISKDIAKRFALNCLIELEVEYNSFSERSLFTFLDSELSVLSAEREILLRSGVIIQIISFDEKYVLNKKYIIKGKVIPFNQKDIYTCFIGQFNEKTLKLEDHTIGLNLEEMKLFSKALIENKTITELILRSNNIESNPQNMNLLKQVLQKNKYITILNLSNNFLGINSENIKYLSVGLKQNSALATLDLSSNLIGHHPDNMKFLCLAIRDNQCITSLILQDNKIGLKRQDMYYLHLAIEDNKSITTLNLENNKLGSYLQDVEYLSSALKKNMTITKLKLGWNEIWKNTSYVEALSLAVRHNNKCKICYDE